MVLNNNAVPESLENEVGESVTRRTSSLPTWKELGPPDLVHLSKSNYKGGSKESGTYHFVTGIDTSSSASIAAYLNTLTFSLGENQIWFGKHPQWKVHSEIYCCYNAFSRLDVRVMAQIPGSVEAYVVDDRGDKRSATEKIWLETFLSAMVRSLIYADDDEYYVSCCRRLSPLTGKEVATKFFDAFRQLFFAGPSLGCASEIQDPSLVKNHLVDAFLKFVKVTGMCTEALEVLEQLYIEEPEVMSIICEVLLIDNQEVKAVEYISKGIEKNPRDACLLELQAKFCQDKKRLDLALDSAIRAVNASPSEFFTWSRLVQVYTQREEYEQALLTLNSCPMFTVHEMDTHRLPQPSRIHLPLPSDGSIDDIWNVDMNSEQDTVDPGLLKLPAMQLRSTFAKAYTMLAEIVSHIGWEALLKHRSNTFLMEEEYRKDKRVKQSTESLVPSVLDSGANNDRNNDNRKSTDGVKSTNGGDNTANTTEVTTAGAAATATATTISKPEKPATSVKEDSNHQLQQQQQQLPHNNNINGDHVRNKRLCERWLDNLFMILYEDLRAYTVWRAEFVHYESQQLPYEKSSLEWELLGNVAYRLKHKEEAAAAFLSCLEIKFSHRALWKLLDYYMSKGDKFGNPNPYSTEALDAIVRLTAWNHRWYTEFSPKLTIYLHELIAKEGLIKVRNSAESKYSRQGVVDLLVVIFARLEEFNASIADY